jgi:hypothetical protein
LQAARTSVPQTAAKARWRIPTVPQLASARTATPRGRPAHTGRLEQAEAVTKNRLLRGVVRHQYATITTLVQPQFPPGTVATSSPPGP